MSYSIPHLHTSGTHYEVGRAVGVEFKNRIQRFIQDFHEFQAQIVPFIAQARGKKLLADYLELIERKYPWYVDEMKGISDGSEINFDIVLALNFRVELFHITNQLRLEANEKDDSTKECSDFMLIDKNYNLLIHNEDSVASVYNTCYIVTYSIKSSDYNGVKSPEEEFTCYCYPGHLPGNAFGFNSSGFCFGVNALYPKELLVNKFPRQILNRVMMSARSLEELEDMFLNIPISYGVCLNIGFFGDNADQIKTNWNSEFYSDSQKSVSLNKKAKLGWNYEIAPNKDSHHNNKVSKHCIIEPLNSELDTSFYSQRYYYHFNHFERFKIEECYNASSQNRKKRADQLREPTDEQDLIEIASDNLNKQHPIFRTLRDEDPDELKTIATALFDMEKKILTIFVKRPIENKPFLIIKMN